MRYFIMTIFSIFLTQASWADFEIKQEVVWQEGTSGPLAREHSSMWIDESSDNLYVSGGWIFEPLQGMVSTTLWQLSLASGSWQQLPVMGNVPSPNGRGAYLPGTNKYIYLVTQEAFFGQRDITWPYQLEIKEGVGHWKMLAYEDLTPGDHWFRPMRLGSFVYSEKNQKFYSVCTATDCDVYSYEFVNDLQLKVEKVQVQGEAPGARVGYSYGFDQELNKFVLFSGQSLQDGSFFDDVWTLDLTQTPAQWKRLEVTLQGRRNPSFSFDQKNHSLVVWGGTSNGVESISGVYVLDISQPDPQWQSFDQGDSTARSSGMGVYDSKRDRVLLGFGNSLRNEELLLLPDLWSIYLSK